MIQKALCWSHLKHTNVSPHHSLLPCSPFMELIPPVPRDMQLCLRTWIRMPTPNCCLRLWSNEEKHEWPWKNAFYPPNSQNFLLFSSHFLAHVPCLIDKDKANLSRNQGHGCCRQTLLRHAPLRCPFLQCFVFLRQLLHRTRGAMAYAGAGAKNLIPVTH